MGLYIPINRDRQLITQHGLVPQTLCCIKEARHRRVSTVQSYLYDVQEYAKLSYSDRSQNIGGWVLIAKGQEESSRGLEISFI